MGHFLLYWSGLLEGKGYNFLSGIFADVTIFTAATGAFFHTRCHHRGCFRGAKYPHGHYKLCHIHHPHVPSSGKISSEHINHQQ